MLVFSIVCCIISIFYMCNAVNVYKKMKKEEGEHE